MEAAAGAVAEVALAEVALVEAAAVAALAASAAEVSAGVEQAAAGKLISPQLNNNSFYEIIGESRSLLGRLFYAINGRDDCIHQ